MKTKISNIEYLWICISQGWHNFASAFRNWGHLMGNYFYQLVNDIDSGKEKLIPIDNLDDLMKDLKDE